MCVFIHLFKIYLQQQFVGWGVFIHLFKIYLQQQFGVRHATSTGHLPTITRPVLCLMRYSLNRCRRKPCPSVNSQNVAISLVIRYYRCRDMETCLMLNQRS